MHSTATSLVAIAQYFWRIRTSVLYGNQQKFNIEAVNENDYPPIRLEILFERKFQIHRSLLSSQLQRISGSVSSEQLDACMFSRHAHATCRLSPAWTERWCSLFSEISALGDLRYRTCIASRGKRQEESDDIATLTGWSATVQPSIDFSGLEIDRHLTVAKTDTFLPPDAYA